MPTNIHFLKLFSLRIYQHVMYSNNFEATRTYNFSAIKGFEQIEVLHMILCRILMDLAKLL